MNRFPRVTLLILLTQPPHLSDQDSVVPTTRLQQRMTKGIPGQAASARLRSALSIAVMCCASAAAVAETGVSYGGLEISGFGTLGALRTNTDHAEVTRDQSQQHGAKTDLSLKQDSLIGIQAYYKANESLEFVAQGVSRYGPRGDFRPELMSAYGQYAATPNLSLRAGRIGMEFYMLADSRLVGYSYLTVRPPREIFTALPFQYVDGADFTAIAPVGDGVLKGRLFLGQSGEEAPVADELLNLRGNPIAGAYAEYQTGNWQWRVTYAQIEFKHELPDEVAALRAGLNQASRFDFPGAAEAAESISLTNTVSRFYSLGAVYDRGPLQVQGMLAQIRHESAIYQDSLAAYLIAGYRIGQFTPFAGIATSRSTADSVSSGLPAAPQFAPLNAGLDGAIARTHTDQTTYTLGVRWDFRRDMALKAQVDMVRGARDSIYLYPTHDADFNGKLNVYSLALDFVF